MLPALNEWGRGGRGGSTAAAAGGPPGDRVTLGVLVGQLYHASADAARRTLP